MPYTVVVCVFVSIAEGASTVSRVVVLAWPSGAIESVVMRVTSTGPAAEGSVTMVTRRPTVTSAGAEMSGAIA